MRQTITLLPFFYTCLLSCCLQAQSLSLDWYAISGGNAYDKASKMAIDAAGNSYYIGTFKEEANGMQSRGGDDVVLFKLDSEGNLQWQQSMGCSSNDQAQDICLDNQANIWICGNFQDTLYLSHDTLFSNGAADAFIAGFDSNGNLIRAWNFGNTDFELSRNLAYHYPHLYWTGIFNDSITIGQETLHEAGMGDLLLVQFDTSGNALWSDAFGGPFIDGVLAMSIDNQARITLSAYFNEFCYFDNNDTIWSNGGNDILILRYDSTGNRLWTKTVGGSAHEAAYALTQDENGNTYVGGTFQDTLRMENQIFVSRGELDIILFSLDSLGELRWANSMVGTEYNQSATMLWDSEAQQLYVAGGFDGTMYGDGDSVSAVRHEPLDAFFAVFSATGTMQMLQSFGNMGNEVVSDMAFDANNRQLILYTTFESYTRIGDTEILGEGVTDILVLGFDMAPLGLSLLPKNQQTWSLYPNPAQDYTNVMNNTEIGGVDEVFICNNLGQVLEKQSLLNNNIDTSRLPQGSYFISFTSTKGQMVSQPLIINH